MNNIARTSLALVATLTAAACQSSDEAPFAATPIPDSVTTNDTAGLKSASCEIVPDDNGPMAVVSGAHGGGDTVTAYLEIDVFDGQGERAASSSVALLEIRPAEPFAVSPHDADWSVGADDDVSSCTVQDVRISGDANALKRDLFPVEPSEVSCRSTGLDPFGDLAGEVTLPENLDDVGFNVNVVWSIDGVRIGSSIPSGRARGSSQPIPFATSVHPVDSDAPVDCEVTWAGTV